MTPRVVILTPYYFPVIGGVESNAERLARFLAGDGVPVQVVTKRIDRTLPDEDRRHGVAIRRIGPRGERSALGKWLVTPAATGWLLRHARTYDVVCCVDYRATGVAALVARSVTGRPVVFQAQTAGVLSGSNADPLLQSIGLDPARGVARALKAPVRAFYGRADGIACISHELEREALACGIPADRVHYFPNAIDMNQFRPPEPGERERLRAHLDLPVDRVICLFVGRLSREKGLTDLLEAWRMLMNDTTSTTEHTESTEKTIPDLGGLRGLGGNRAFPLLLVAGPDMTGHAWDVGVSGRAFVERHGLDDSVRFVGPVADVAPLVRSVDLMVQPSHFEALGLSAIEALASGVPVVASAVGGLLEFVVDGVNGRLVPAQNPPALAAALRPLLSDAAARAALAVPARASVRDEYDERAVFGRMRRLFERLAERR